MAAQSASMQTTWAWCAGRPSTSALLGQEHRGLAIRQHERQPRLRIRRVQRDIGAAGFENAEEPDDHLQGALHTDAHEDLWAHAVRPQVVRQPIGAGVQLPVGQ